MDFTGLWLWIFEINRGETHFNAKYRIRMRSNQFNLFKIKDETSYQMVCFDRKSWNKVPKINRLQYQMELAVCWWPDAVLLLIVDFYLQSHVLINFTVWKSKCSWNHQHHVVLLLVYNWKHFCSLANNHYERVNFEQRHPTPSIELKKNNNCQTETKIINDSA